MKRIRRRFVLLEVVMATCLLAIGTIGLFWMSSQANRGAMDSYFGFLALNLAKEPLEVFRGFGYDWLKEYDKHPLPSFPLELSPIVDSELGLVHHPAECAMFKRSITLTPVEEHGTRAIRVQVQVVPIEQTQVMVWFMRQSIVLEGMVVEKPL